VFGGHSAVQGAEVTDLEMIRGTRAVLDLVAGLPNKVLSDTRILHDPRGSTCSAEVVAGACDGSG
jgi:hypothetical protein